MGNKYAEFISEYIKKLEKRVDRLEQENYELTKSVSYLLEFQRWLKGTLDKDVDNDS